MTGREDAPAGATRPDESLAVSYLAWAVGEVDRLRAELAETRAAGDALAAAAGTVQFDPPDTWISSAVVRWRSVRGDAPTEPPAGGARRCDECGRFSRELNEVWGSWPNVGPDHEACGECRADLVAPLADDNDGPTWEQLAPHERSLGGESD